MSTVRVTAILVAYNGGEMLERCVDAVLASHYRALDVVIVDNASSDRAGAIAAYRRVLDPMPFLVQDYGHIPILRIPINYKLAVLEEADGQLAEARKHYQAYLDRWGNPDVPIPNVDDAKARLAKLNEQM